MKVYCIDTSSLVNLRLFWPRSKRPDIWRRVEKLIKDDRLIAPVVVLEELKKRRDHLAKWAQKHASMFKRDTAEIVKLVSEINKEFPELVDHEKLEEDADPFVVALAVAESRTLLKPECVVVTDEKYVQGAQKIPHVCECYDLSYMTLHQMFMAEGWHKTKSPSQ